MSPWSYKTNWRAHQPFPVSELSLMIYCNSCFPQNCEKSSNCQNNHNIVQKTFWHFLWFSTLLAYYIIRFTFENGNHQENLPELVIQQFILKLPWQMVTFLLYPKRFSTLKLFYFTLIFAEHAGLCRPGELCLYLLKVFAITIVSFRNYHE